MKEIVIYEGEDINFRNNFFEFIGIPSRWRVPNPDPTTDKNFGGYCRGLSCKRNYTAAVKYVVELKNMIYIL